MAFEYSSKPFQAAVSKKQLCKAEIFSTIRTPFEIKQPPTFKDYCMKSSSNVAFLCPKEVLANVTDESLPYNTKANVIKMNKAFKKVFKKKSKKKKKKKKKRRKKKYNKKKKGRKKKKKKGKKKKRRRSKG